MAIRKSVISIILLLALVFSFASSVSQPASAFEFGPVEQFIERLYRLVLNRFYDENGLVYWSTSLRNGSATGAGVAEGFFFSPEYIGRARTNEQFVNDLYLTLLNRAPDESGRAFWEDVLSIGWPRQDVFAGFVNSTEFGGLCTQAGIARGLYTPPPGMQISIFITRLYRTTLFRAPDAAGLAHWTNALLSGGATGASVAGGFIFSPEMTNEGLSNTRFVERLYNAIMGRPADPAGLAAWGNLLDTGLSREEVFAGCVSSNEFLRICQNAGIARGTYTPPPGGMIRTFVTRLYETTLSRKPDTTGLEFWTGALLNGSTTGASIAQGFIFSPEMNNRNLSHADFVEILYRALMGRASDAPGKLHWEIQLLEGVSRHSVFASFVASAEFDRICRSYGIVRGSVPRASGSGVLNGKIIFLDAGHGTVGSPGAGGYNEAVAMLDLARKLETLLSAQGADVVMIRTNEVNIPIADRCAIINIRALERIRNASNYAEVTSLIGRMSSIIGNPVNARTLMNVDPFNANAVIHPDLRRVFEYTNSSIIRDNFLMISLHSNATANGSTTVRGAEVYYISPAEFANTNRYYPGYSYVGESRLFADILLNHINNTGIPRRANGLRAENYAMIREVNIPAVLAENGFHTNPQDRALLADPTYREGLAWAYRNAIIQYFP